MVRRSLKLDRLACSKAAGATAGRLRAYNLGAEMIATGGATWLGAYALAADCRSRD